MVHRPRALLVSSLVSHLHYLSAKRGYSHNPNPSHFLNNLIEWQGQLTFRAGGENRGRRTQRDYSPGCFLYFCEIRESTHSFGISHTFHPRYKRQKGMFVLSCLGREMAGAKRVFDALKIMENSFRAATKIYSMVGKHNGWVSQSQKASHATTSP
jgi:hypothetical protein